MLRTLKSNFPFSSPRDDTSRAGYGNRARSDFLPVYTHLEEMRGSKNVFFRVADASWSPGTLQEKMWDVEEILGKEMRTLRDGVGF